MKNKNYLFSIKNLLTLMAISFSFTTICFAATNTLHLEWNAPTSGGAVVGYILYYGTTDYNTTDDIVNKMTKVDTGSSQTTYDIEGLDCSEAYYVYVQAYNASGQGVLSPVNITKVIPSEISGLKSTTL